MPREGTNSPGMAPLQRLVLEQMRRRGWDPKHVEERGVKHATLHRYMNPVELKQLPRQSVLEDLARGLDLPVDRIRRAALDSIGWGQTSVTEENPRPEGEVDRRSVAELTEAGEAPLLSIDPEALRGLSEEQQAVVIREAQEHALRTARLLRGDR